MEIDPVAVEASTPSTIASTAISTDHYQLSPNLPKYLLKWRHHSPRHLADLYFSRDLDGDVTLYCLPTSVHPTVVRPSLKAHCSVLLSSRSHFFDCLLNPPQKSCQIQVPTSVHSTSSLLKLLYLGYVYLSLEDLDHLLEALFILGIGPQPPVNELPVYGPLTPAQVLTLVTNFLSPPSTPNPPVCDKQVTNNPSESPFLPIPDPTAAVFCPLTQKYILSSQLSSHKTACAFPHGKDIICDLCKKTFLTGEAYLRHLNKRHPPSPQNNHIAPVSASSRV